MAEVELPDPREVEEKAGDPFTKQVALCVAIYAVVLAVTALGGNNAAKEMMMAQQQSSNQWAYYQAKVVRENMYLLEAEKLELEVEVRGAGPSSDERKRLETVRERLETVRAKYAKKAADYKHEKEEIKARAEELEKERDVAARRDPYFDYAEVLLQIAIVLASVAMLSGRREAYYASLVLAALGLILCINGYGLFVKIPGLE